MQLDQVLTNLLENAARFSPPHGEISIAVSPWKHAVQVRISDQGKGIAPEERERVFEAFYQGDAGGHGSGLGLTIARAIVLAHGGRIRIEGSPTGGVSVVFELPALEGPAPGRRPRSLRGGRSGRHRARRVTRVLVVDDESQIRRALRTSLEAHGYEVRTASNGEEAIVAAAETALDLVFLDLGLPDLDGTEVIRRVRSFSDVPVIVLSVRDRQADKVAALDAGADDYVTKPFGMEEVLARLRAALRRSPADQAEPATLTFGTLLVDLGKRLVTLDGERIHLTTTEYALLEALVTNPGKLLTHQWLLRRSGGRGTRPRATTSASTSGRSGASSGTPRRAPADPDRAGRRATGGSATSPLPAERRRPHDGRPQPRIPRDGDGATNPGSRGVVKRVLLGRALATHKLEHQLLPKLLALPVFSSDALSSVAYATEEMMLVLALAGAAALGYMIPIGVAIALLLVIVVTSYRQTVRAYPRGGGSYIVAKENLGTIPGWWRRPRSSPTTC